MYISRFEFANYKSFHKPCPLVFAKGFNIISGQNNAGKTALLEALGLNFAGKPHKSLKTAPARDTALDQTSWADVSFAASPGEVQELLTTLGSSNFQIARPAASSDFARKIDYTGHSAGEDERLLAALFSQKFLEFTVRLQAGPTQGISWRLLQIPSYGLYTADKKGTNWNFAVCAAERGGVVHPVGSVVNSQPVDLGLTLADSFRRHVYRFTAERMNVAASAHAHNTVLNPNASNLPEVLNQLQHNPSRFRELNRRVHDILPHVQQVSVRASGPGMVEIVVWCHDPESQREDLAVPLSESGTGIGQVLAILYVVMTSNRPQVIIIDEPQSFLHPGAARKLIEALKLYPEHQFIIATHSPTIISAANPQTITLARLNDSESSLQQLDTGAEKGVQTTLLELGIRLADTYGADDILWVEGRTEEKCFPLIVERIIKGSLGGTAVLGIRQTGDLEGRDAKKVFEIYRRLSTGITLLPPAIAFILDSECRNVDQKRELDSLSGGLALFLPRRMYENYLLNPRAIAHVANSLEGFRPPANPVTPEEVHAAMDAKLTAPEYYCGGAVPAIASERANTVDASRVLREVFNRLSEARVPYQKVPHGIALTEWIIASAPEDLAEIAGLLVKALELESTMRIAAR